MRIGKRAQVVIGIGLIVIAAAFLLMGLNFSLEEGTFVSNGVASLTMFSQAVAAAENSIQMAPYYMQVTIYGNNTLCSWNPQLSEYTCTGGSIIRNISYAVGPSLDPGVITFSGGACFSVMLNPFGKAGGAGGEKEGLDALEEGAESTLKKPEPMPNEAPPTEGPAPQPGENSPNEAGDLADSENEEPQGLGSYYTLPSQFIFLSPILGRVSAFYAYAVQLKNELIDLFSNSFSAFAYNVKLIFSQNFISVLVKNLKTLAKNLLLTSATYFGFSFMVQFLVPLVVSHFSDLGAQVNSAIVNGFYSGEYLNEIQRTALIYYSSAQAAAVAAGYGNAANNPDLYQFGEKNVQSIVSAGNSLYNQLDPFGIIPYLPSIGIKLPSPLSISSPTSNLQDFTLKPGATSAFYAALGTLFLTWANTVQCFQIAQDPSVRSIITDIGDATTLLTLYQVQNDRVLVGTYYVGDTGAVYLEGYALNRPTEVAAPVIVDGQDLCQFTTNSPPPDQSILSEVFPSENGNLVFTEQNALFNTQCTPSDRGYPITLSQFVKEVEDGDPAPYINLPWDMAIAFQGHEVCIYQLDINDKGTPVMSVYSTLSKSTIINPYEEERFGNPSQYTVMIKHSYPLVFGFALDCINSTISLSTANIQNLLQSGEAFYINNNSIIGFSVPLNMYANPFSGDTEDGGQFVPGNLIGAKITLGGASPSLSLVLSILNHFVSVPSNLDGTLFNNIAYGFSNALGTVAYQDAALAGLISVGSPEGGAAIAGFFGIVNTAYLLSLVPYLHFTNQADLSFGPTDYVSVYFTNSGGTLSFLNDTVLYAVYPNQQYTIYNNIFSQNIFSSKIGR